VIRFLKLKNFLPSEMHHQLVEVCREGVMKEENVRKWYRLFNEGRADVYNEKRSSGPSVIAEDLKVRVNGHVRENRRFTTDELHGIFPHVSLSVFYENVTIQLR
jgi:hypothetical protein